MSTSALARQNDSLRARLARVRREADQVSVSVMADGAGLIAAFAIGKAEASDALPPTPFDLDATIFYGGLAKLGGYFVDGEAGELLNAAGQSLLTIYAYQQGKGE